MIRRILIAYSVEMTKAIRLQSTYIGPVLVVLAVLATPLIIPFSQDNASDYGFISYATPTTLNLLGYFILLIYSAGLVSTELGSGTIRMILVRPILRGEFIAAKCLLGATYALLLNALVATTAWMLAYTLGDLSGVRFGGEILYTDGEMRIAYILALLLNMLPQCAAVTYAVMISTLTRSAATAIACTLGIAVFIDSIKYPLRIEPFFFSTYLDRSWQVFADRAVALESQWFPNVQYTVLASVISIVVFSSVAIFSIGRRNITA